MNRRPETRGSTLTTKLAAFFALRPNVWIDGRELATIAGSYAWRTRVSDLRRPPFNLQIENRQRRIHRPDGRPFTVSEYRLVVPTPSATLLDLMDQGQARV